MPKYIELEKALESLQHKYENMYGCNPSFYAGYQFALENLKRIKSADVAPVVHGEWILDAKNHCHCSRCLYGRNIETQIGWNYCHACGAKMILEDG